MEQTQESDSTFFSDFEDYVIIFLIVISIAIFVVVWMRKDNLLELKKANRIALIVVIVSTPFSIYGIVKEIHRFSDLSDEFSSLLGGTIFAGVLRSKERGSRKKDKEHFEKGWTELRLFLSQDLRTLPSWALNSDYLFLSKKMDKARRKEKTGDPAHKRYSTYIANLQKKLGMIESEMKRREK